MIIFPQAQRKARVNETDSDFVFRINILRRIKSKIWSDQLSYFNFLNLLFCELCGCRLIEPHNSHNMTKTEFLLTTSIQYQADK